MNGSMEEADYTADGEIGETSSSDMKSSQESLVHNLAERLMGPVTAQASAVVGNVQTRIVPVASSVLEQWKEDRWQELRQYEEKGGSKGSLLLTFALCFIIVFHLDLIRLYRHLFQKGGIVERSTFHLRFRYQQWKYRKRSTKRSNTGGILSRLSMATRRSTHKTSNISTENAILSAKLGSPTSTASTMEAQSSVTHNNNNNINQRSAAPPPNSRGKMMLLMQQKHAPLSPNVSKKTLGGSFNSNTSSSQVSGTIRRTSNNNFTDLKNLKAPNPTMMMMSSDRSHSQRSNISISNRSHKSHSTSQTSRSRASSRRSVQWSLKHGSVSGSVTSYKSKPKNRITTIGSSGSGNHQNHSSSNNSISNNSSSRKSSMASASSPVSLAHHDERRRRQQQQPNNNNNNNGSHPINTRKYKLGSSPATNLLDSTSSIDVDLDANLQELMNMPPPSQEQHPDSVVQKQEDTMPPTTASNPPPPPPPPPSNGGAASSDDDGGFKTPQTGNSPCSTPSNATGKRIVDVNRVQDMTNRMKQRRSREQNTSTSPHAGFRRAATVDSHQLQSSQHSGSNKSSFSSTSQSHTSNANTSTNTPTRTPRGKKNAQANTTRLGETRRRLSAQHANSGAHTNIAHPSLEGSSQPSGSGNNNNNSNELRRAQTSATPTRYNNRSRSGPGAMAHHNTPGVPAPSPFGRSRSGLVARSRSGNPAVASTMTASQMYMQRHQNHGPVGPSSTSGGSSNTKGRRAGRSSRSMDRSTSPPPPPTRETYRSGPSGRQIARDLSRQELGYE